MANITVQAVQVFCAKVGAAAKPVVVDVAAKGIEYAKGHPYGVGTMAVSLVLSPILGAGWMGTLVLKAVGFTPAGPAAGGLAAWYQATFLGGYIPADGLFAAAQRLAMG